MDTLSGRGNASGETKAIFQPSIGLVPELLKVNELLVKCALLFAHNFIFNGEQSLLPVDRSNLPPFSDVHRDGYFEHVQRPLSAIIAWLIASALPNASFERLLSALVPLGSKACVWLFWLRCEFLLRRAGCGQIGDGRFLRRLRRSNRLSA
jgi:hypothetical protein